MVNKNFTLVRGNSLQFRVNFINPTILPSDIKLILKNKSSDSESVLELSLNDGIEKVYDISSYDFYISSVKTSELELLNYIYQIECKFGADNLTIVQGKLIITPEV